MGSQSLFEMLQKEGKKLSRFWGREVGRWAVKCNYLRKAILAALWDSAAFTYYINILVLIFADDGKLMGIISMERSKMGTRWVPSKVDGI